ncbi:hypothetical protein JZU68_01735 [bacterium]|nr:hypothetical protein [bacterium]
MGLKLINELRQYPKVVEFENDNAGKQNTILRQTISDVDVYEKVWDIMSDHYKVDVRKL